MTVNGTVYKLSGNYAQVKTQRPKACESCSNYSLCSGKDIDMKVLNPIGAKVGDSVEVEVSDDSKVFYIMAYLFLVPVALIFAGYGLYLISLKAMLLLIPLVAAYFAGIYILNKKFSLKSEIVQVTESAELECMTKNKENEQ